MLLFCVFHIRFLSAAERLSWQYEFEAVEEIMTCGFYRKHKATSQTLLAQHYIIIFLLTLVLKLKDLQISFLALLLNRQVMSKV